MNESERTKQGSTISFYAGIRDYERILKSGGPFSGAVTIYGNDKHLVVVTTDGIVESLKYIELKNVRAVLIKHLAMAPRALFPAVTLAALMALAFLWFGELSSGFVFVSLLSILLSVLLFMGMKDCSLRIVTDVNDHLISGVHKYRVAKKLLYFLAERMKPYLEESLS